MSVFYHIGLVFSRIINYILVVIVGGIDMMTQAIMLAKKPHVVVGETYTDIRVSTVLLLTAFKHQSVQCVFYFSSPKSTCFLLDIFQYL